MKKYYWVSWSHCTKDGNIGFGNAYISVYCSFFNNNIIHEWLREYYNMKHLSVLYWKELDEKTFDLQLANDVTFLEIQDKKKEGVL